jgi:hypothetical protein
VHKVRVWRSAGGEERKTLMCGRSARLGEGHDGPCPANRLRVFIANKTLMNRKVTAVKGMAVGRKMRATDKQREEIEHKSPSCPRATL